MTAIRRPSAPAIAALGLVAIDFLVRSIAGGPYRGATVTLLAACGLALVPLLPDELSRPALRLAVLPALALGSFTVVLTTIATLGIALTETSVRVGIAALVVGAAAISIRRGRPTRIDAGYRREFAAMAAVLALGIFSAAAAWDVVGPFPPRGTDWGHYLLYADEVERQEALLIDNPLAGEDDEVFADPAMVGAWYGGSLILDGGSSRSLASQVVAASAFSVLSVVAAAGGLWGVPAGLVAGAVYSVAPIRLDPMYWYGLGTALGLMFLPLVVLGIGLTFRGRRDASTVVLLGLSLVCVGAAHSTTAVVAALAMGVAVALDSVRAMRATGRETYLRRWWRHGAIAPLLASAGIATGLGLGVVAHMIRQARRLGDPVDWRFFEPDWLTWRALDEYLSIEFLLLGCASVLILVLRRRARDPALLAVGALVLGSLLASQLWRLEISYEYRRAVYPFGLALALLVGASLMRISRWSLVAPACVVICVYLAHETIGLRLPERLLSERVPTSSAPAALDSVRTRIDRGALPDTEMIVTDSCLHFIVPYLLERPTISAFEEWQVAFERRLVSARKAARVLAGGTDGRRLARVLGVGYLVADPRCTPTLAPGLGGRIVVDREDVLVVRLPTS